MDINTQKQRLLDEKNRLEASLSLVAKKSIDIKGDWEPMENDLNTDKADESDVADAIENYQTNVSETEILEKSLADVSKSLENIENGTYGKCSVCGNMIEEDRLSALPYAMTCKAHMN